MKYNKFKYYLGVVLVIISIILFVAGIGLLIWAGVGQFIAQINFDGQYKSFRTIQDISLWGYTGFIPVLGSIPLFITGINLQ